ncbi:hypothetical protein DL96DRAFT_1742258 [Flagelloscypha sp. PMI_526]|nr:hypothetical protein DL96DRAFT_1742258 [Flagelloscypha sp. PMI_526]
MAPIRSHKKSKTGCRTCKKRKVKCDEIGFPRCQNCINREIACDWPANLAPSLSSPSSPQDASSTSNLNCRADYPSSSKAKSDSQCLSIYVDSTTPTLDMTGMELREYPVLRHVFIKILTIYSSLVHHWTTETCYWLLDGDKRVGTSSLHYLHAYQVTVPKLAFVFPSLMHAILSVSSMHLHSRGHAYISNFGPSRDYYALAVYHRRKSEDQAQMPCPEKTCPGDDHCPNIATAHFMATNLLSILDFCSSILDVGFNSNRQLALLVAWLENHRKTLTDFYFAHRKQLSAGPLTSILNLTSVFSGIVDADVPFHSPAFIRTTRFPSSLHSISNIHLDEIGLLDMGSSEVYQDAVRGLEHVHRLFSCNAPLRAIFTFPAVIPFEFLQLLKKRDPRALIILAHFCELFQGSKELTEEKLGWWRNGKTDFILLIRGMLTEKWQLYLDQTIVEARGGERELGVHHNERLYTQAVVVGTMATNVRSA